jgi:hypothetical protein
MEELTELQVISVSYSFDLVIKGNVEDESSRFWKSEWG